MASEEDQVTIAVGEAKWEDSVVWMFEAILDILVAFLEIRSSTENALKMDVLDLG